MYKYAFLVDAITRTIYYTEKEMRARLLNCQHTSTSFAYCEDIRSLIGNNPTWKVVYIGKDNL